MHAAATELPAELRAHTRPPFVLAGTEGERLIRLCFIASHFERILREGTRPRASAAGRPWYDTPGPP
ncbi:hypothetical protein OH807_40835 [Kitasatospora sp. NBC_01560]|uniref:hypothetical protein n=1 Tax=Kitasatospora sp. NBC_01560 TaxID=2975965 RepID=UPI00386DA99F